MQPIAQNIKKLLKEALVQVAPVETQVPIQVAGPKVDADFTSPIAIAVFNANRNDGCFGFEQPRLLGQSIVSMIPQNDIILETAVAGNGFINIKVRKELIEQTLTQTALSNQVELSQQGETKTILIDFSSPNIAKEMHVGHLRSTILGDCLCRIFELYKNDVKRVNHLGDWGTQFGMLLNYLEETYPNWEEVKPDISDIDLFYKAAKRRFDESPEFKEQSRLKVVDLQSGEEKAVKIWQYIFKVSRDYLQIIYDRLNIQLEDFGESFYNPMLPGVLQELKDMNLCVESEGAWVVNIPGKTIPLMAQKTDGGYGYDSTDLAAAKYRMQQIGIQRAIYVTDSGQFQHFDSIFEAAKLAGWHTPPATRMDHAGFGVVLGEDGKKFKARSGESVKLISLLDEAKSRARVQIENRQGDQGTGMRTHISEEEIDMYAERIGMAAIKYFDLKQNRISTYKFSFDQMLDPKGNTAVYLLYAYARICSIIRKGGDEAIQRALQSRIEIGHQKERALALTLARLPDTLEQVKEELLPHKLCDLLYEISVKFSEFYNVCRVLEGEEQDSRILLCIATRVIMEKCFNLLGIEPIERI